MNFFAIEHSKTAYRADFALYGLAVLGLSSYLVLQVPIQHGWEILTLSALGLASWTLIEYLLHRFVLHRLEPFRSWHAAHHQRPTALICAPTILSATLIVSFVFIPAFLLGSQWSASAVTLGVLIGYLFYATTHHAIHHWRGKNAWFKQLKRRHALHHHLESQACFGVTSLFWDRLLGTTDAPSPSLAERFK